MKINKTRRKRRVRARQQSLKSRMKEAARNGTHRRPPHAHVELSVLRKKYQVLQKAEMAKFRKEERTKQALGVLAPSPEPTRKKK